MTRLRISSFSFLQDIVLSLLASLSSILVIRWVSEPIPGFTWLVLRYLAVALVGTLAGVLLSGCSRDVKKYATVRSIARVLYALLVKEGLLVVSIVVGLVAMPSALMAALAVVVDIVLSVGAMSYTRVAARLFSRGGDIPERASRRTALVAGVDLAALHLASELEKQGYEILGLLSRKESMSGRVVSDHVVYYCRTDEDLNRLQWRLGGVDGVFFPRTEYAEHKHITTQTAINQPFTPPINSNGMGCPWLVMLSSVAST